MVKRKSFSLYMNAKGHDPMKFVKTFKPDEIPADEGDITKAIETVVAMKNSLVNEVQQFPLSLAIPMGVG